MKENENLYQEVYDKVRQEQEFHENASGVHCLEVERFLSRKAKPDEWYYTGNVSVKVRAISLPGGAPVFGNEAIDIPGTNVHIWVNRFVTPRFLNGRVLHYDDASIVLDVRNQKTYTTIPHTARTLREIDPDLVEPLLANIIKDDFSDIEKILIQAGGFWKDLVKPEYLTLSH